MLLVYVGPFRPGVVIPALDELEVEFGVPFEVEEGVAGLLVEQGTFRPATDDEIAAHHPAPSVLDEGTDPASAEED
jgi:hypothetical protein